MVAIKDMEMPESCSECERFFRGCELSFDFGNYLYTRHCDCPLVEIEERKVGKWIPVYQGDEIIDYRCSNCNFGSTFGKRIHGMNYCNNCGSYNQGMTLNDLLKGNKNGI